jgi:hypothetical protein
MFFAWLTYISRWPTSITCGYQRRNGRSKAPGRWRSSVQGHEMLDPHCDNSDQGAKAAFCSALYPLLVLVSRGAAPYTRDGNLGHDWSSDRQSFMSRGTRGILDQTRLTPQFSPSILHLRCGYLPTTLGCITWANEFLFRRYSILLSLVPNMASCNK